MGVIHGVRIAAKQLRYLLEVAHEFDVAGSQATLAWLRKLRQYLGNWHDAGSPRADADRDGGTAGIPAGSP